MRQLTRVPWPIGALVLSWLRLTCELASPRRETLSAMRRRWNVWPRSAGPVLADTVGAILRRTFVSLLVKQAMQTCRRAIESHEVLEDRLTRLPGRDYRQKRFTSCRNDILVDQL